MNEPKKHHYVPTSYQDLFRNPETRELYRLDKESGKSNRHNPDNKLYKNHLYRMDNPPPGYCRTYIEKPLLSKLDERFKKAIINISDDISSVDKKTLSECISFLRNRTPSRIKEFGEHAARCKLFEIYQGILSDPKKSEDANVLGLDLGDFEKFSSSLQGITLSAGHDYNLQGFLVSSSFQALDFFDMQWTLMKSCNSSFITCDKPVAAVEEIDDKDNIVSQYFAIPLSSQFCVKIEFIKGGLFVNEIDEGEVYEINRAIAFSAERLIVGPNEQVLRVLYNDLQT
ncbi:DUF4238 domain-containing protein [Pseudomonas aeruginosa]